jgi:hypothetical protein
MELGNIGTIESGQRTRCVPVRVMVPLANRPMHSLEVDGFYTLCLCDAIRPTPKSASSLHRAAADLVWAARTRGVEQRVLLDELERESRALDWVTPYEVEVHSRALHLGRMAIEVAYATFADAHPDVQPWSPSREQTGLH